MLSLSHEMPARTPFHLHDPPSHPSASPQQQFPVLPPSPAPSIPQLVSEAPSGVPTYRTTLPLHSSPPTTVTHLSTVARRDRVTARSDSRLHNAATPRAMVDSTPTYSTRIRNLVSMSRNFRPSPRPPPRSRPSAFTLSSALSSSAPPPFSTRVKRGSVHASRGRPCQDTVRIEDLPDVPLRIMAVFDGHGPHGEEVATMAAEELVSSAKRSLVERPENPRFALLTAFSAASRVVDASGLAAESGTTATAVVLQAGELTVGHVGDTAVAVSTSGLVTRIHNVDECSEMERVEQSGGRVVDGYVSAACESDVSLAVTRALGDVSLREVGVTPEPEFKEMEFCGEAAFVIIATDGLWEAQGGVSVDRALEAAQRGLNSSYMDDDTMSLALDELMALAIGPDGAPSDDTAIVISYPV